MVQLVCDGCGTAYERKQTTLNRPQRKSRKVFCSIACRNRNYGPREALASRFWRRVQKTDETACWLWTGSIVPTTGYGSIRVNGKGLSAHRVAWELTNGEIADGLMVCHHCDVRACCNPAHLFLGTAKDNNADMDRKGRGRHWGPPKRGEQSHSAKLTDAQVADVRRRYAAGETQSQIARSVGVTQAQIHNLVRNKQRKESGNGIG